MPINPQVAESITLSLLPEEDPVVAVEGGNGIAVIGTTLGIRIAYSVHRVMFYPYYLVAGVAADDSGVTVEVEGAGPTFVRYPWPARVFASEVRPMAELLASYVSARHDALRNPIEIPDDCAFCGRSINAEAASLRALAIAGEMGLSPMQWDYVQHEAGARRPIRQGTLERGLGLSYEEATAVLSSAERARLLRRSGDGWIRAGLGCDSCYSAPMASKSAASREPVPAQLRFRVLQRDGFRCQYCGTSRDEGAVLHVDHVVPYATGGSTTEDNLITACDACNLGKSDGSVI